MKAFETRKASVQPQYDSAMKDIRQAMGWGWKSAHVGHGTLYPEVAEMIAKEGVFYNGKYRRKPRQKRN